MYRAPLVIAALASPFWSSTINDGGPIRGHHSKRITGHIEADSVKIQLAPLSC